MKIRTLEVCDFKGFCGQHTIKFDSAAKNLVLYGENGSGKTSLFQALRLLLDSSRTPQDFAPHANIFRDAAHAGRGFVRITLEDGSVFTWSETAANGNTHSNLLLSDASKAKRFLDYKGLLPTYFIDGHNTQIDVFKLLVEDIFADSESTANTPRKTFREDWQALETLKPKRYVLDTRPVRALNAALGDFNRSLNDKLSQIRTKAQEILALFDPDLQLDWQFDPVSYQRKTKTFEGHVWLKPSFHGRVLSQHQNLLNEARLSAIAVSIYFAAVLQTLPSALRVLALDDVLIGLDMENRKPILKALETHFANYQIALFTYDLVWFDIIQSLVNKSKWKCLKIHRPSDVTAEIPIVEDGGYLATARAQLARGDLRAAANYARSAFEDCMQRFCEKKDVPIKFKRKIKELRADEFKKAILEWQKIQPALVIDATLETELMSAQSQVLNPLSHAQVIALTTREVREALDVVGQLEVALR